MGASDDNVRKKGDEYTCNLCGGLLTGNEERGVCPTCNSRPRTRTIKILYDEHICHHILANILTMPLLAVSCTKLERSILQPYYDKFLSVSLFGKYGKDHLTNIDVRNLESIEDSSCAGYFASLLFDYFVEHEDALSEAYRVLAANGIFATHIEPQRLKFDGSPPTSMKKIVPSKGYYEYIPDGQGMESIQVGVDWFLKAISRIGFKAVHYRILDPPSGYVADWFVGIKKVDRKIHPIANYQKSQPLEKTWEFDLASEHGERRYVLEAAIPDFPYRDEVSAGRRVYFADHPMDEHGNPKDTVISVGMGCVFVSLNLGRDWEKISIKDFERSNFVNAYQLPSGNIILQERGWNPNSGKPVQSHGRIVTLSKDYSVCSVTANDVSQWHGSRSIGSKNGTTMYANYALNAPKTNIQERIESSVYRSTDDGMSWQRTFSTKEIRHFHTLQPDPGKEGVWWLTSGDVSDACRIWQSRDDGLTWNERTNDFMSLAKEAGICKQEILRQTDLHFFNDSLLWGTDDRLSQGSQLFLLNNRFQFDSIVPCAKLGPEIRNIIWHEDMFLVFAQGSRFKDFSTPSIWAFTLADPSHATLIFKDENPSSKISGFSFSVASSRSKDGVFFSKRGADDLLSLPGVHIVRWTLSRLD